MIKRGGTCATFSLFSRGLPDFCVSFLWLGAIKVSSLAPLTHHSPTILERRNETPIYSNRVTALPSFYSLYQSDFERGLSARQTTDCLPCNHQPQGRFADGSHVAYGILESKAFRP
ncbi:MAG TPA: hypothetical protein VND94_05295, partial [Terriglobia bacterium]|nr:hypothetical protein [Terriglobia bacterium]